jgi:ketosteroid isomerase-like protein
MSVLTDRRHGRVSVVATTTELDEFSATILARQAEAEAAIVQADVEPRLRLWSRRAPVTLFGALGPNRSGWEELSRTFHWVADRFSGQRVTNFRWEVEVADVSGDLGYTVGYERFDVSRDGGPVESVTLRVTHVYRREEGEWRIVHRHGDFAPVDESPERKDR